MKKHPVELVRAIKNVVSGTCAVDSEPDARIYLLMVGDGELMGECERLARESNLPVTFTGFLNQTEIVGAYVAGDCLVLPSDHGETWGLVVNEAMACGRPAIVSDQAGCASDLIRDGETGFVFPFGDWDRLAELLAQCASDRNAIIAMGERARKRIADYSPNGAADGMAQAVHAMIAGRL